MIETAEELYDNVLNFESFCASIKDSNVNKEIFSIKFKILFLIYKNKQLSPTNLSNLLKMAKSNVALFCKQLLQEQVIISRLDELDHRIVYYCVTKKGEKQVLKQLECLNKNLECCFSEREIKDIHNYTKKINKIFQKTGE